MAYGLPDAILTDHGSPFGSCGLLGLSRLSIWWMRLGIKFHRIVPGHPEQNGRHERMHLTLKLETTRPAGANLLQQQEKFERFKEIYNTERPHESLAMKTASDFYQLSMRPFPKELPEIQYPLHAQTKIVSAAGNVKFGRKLSSHLDDALAYQPIGLREEVPGLWRVSFMNLDLGLFDGDENKFNHSKTRCSHPWVEKLSPMSPY